MNAFIDCGSYEGGTIRRFIQSEFYKPDFKIFAFDANPRITKSNYPDIVEFFPNAVWVENCVMDFYINTRNVKRQSGSSVYKEKITGSLDKNNPLKVNAIDFHEWLSKTFTSDDYVIVKMNIEGAEYKVLERCISLGSIHLIKKLFIEFHAKKILLKNDTHDKLVQSLREIKTLELFMDSEDPLEKKFFGMHRSSTEKLLK